MATAVHLSRLHGTNTMPALQGDTALAVLASQLEALLASKPLALLTGADVHAALAPLHAGTALTYEAPLYWWYWDEVLQEWVRYCQTTAIVSVPQGDDADPIVLRIEDRAKYA